MYITKLIKSTLGTKITVAVHLKRDMSGIWNKEQPTKIGIFVVKKVSYFSQ